MNKKALDIFCLVGWSVCLVFIFVYMCLGVKVSPSIAFWPTSFCVFHNIDKLIPNG